MIIFTLLFVSIILLFVRWWHRRRKIQCCKQFKNGLWSMPIIGHFYLIMGNSERHMKGFQALGREALRQGGVTSFYTWLLDFYYPVVADPVIAEAVLKNCLEKGDVLKMFKPLLGDGLLISPAPTWRPRRKIINTMFGLKVINQFVEIFRKNNDIMIENLKREADLGPFSIYDHIANYTLDSVCETVLGVELESQKDLLQVHPVMQTLTTVFRLAANRMCNPLVYNQTIYEMTPSGSLMKFETHKLHQFLLPIITSNLQKYLNNEPQSNEIHDNESPKHILRQMIESSSSEVPATVSYLLDETKHLAFGGSDTTAAGFSFIMMMLALHQDVQEKVYNEISDVLGDINNPIEAQDLPRMKYTELVIKETIRLYPPIPFIVRNVYNDLVLPNGKTMVKGMAVIINIWAVHRNTEYWGPDAEVFRPERFLEPITHPAAFLGFSCGVRNCIGYQYALTSLKTSIASLLRQFRVTPAPANKQANEHEPLRLQFDIVLRHVDNFMIQLKSR